MQLSRSRTFARTTAVLVFTLAGTAAAGPPTTPEQPQPAQPAETPPAAAAPTAATTDAAAAQAPEERTFEKSALGVHMLVRHFTLDNGLRVYVLEDHSIPAIAMHLGFDVGSRDEEPGRTGFAHFFEHMMFKGSENVPEGKHFEYIQGVGGRVNAFTMAEITQYFEVFPSHYLDRMLWLESDRLRSLAITQENVDNQRQAVKEEKAMRFDNQPYTKALMAFNGKVWQGTGYAHPPIGTDQDLDAATTEDVQAFFDRYYVPNNAVLTFVGDVNYEDIKPRVEKYFGSIPRGADRNPFPAIDHTQSSPLEQRVQDPLAQQSLLLVGWKMVPADHPDFHAATLLMNILLRGDSSRITRLLKDEKKLVMAALAAPSGLLGGSDAVAAFGIYLPLQGASFDDIKKVVKDEVAKAKRTGVTAKELEKAINQITVDTMNELATNNGRALMITQNILRFDDPTYTLTDLEKYQAVTLKDIKRVANQYLTDNWLVLEVEPKS